MFSQGKLHKSYYETEEVDFFDYVDRERMSMCEIDKMMHELRLEGKMAYTWLYPDEEICNGGLRCLDSDSDILAMTDVIKDKDLKIVKMYVIHLTDEEANLKLEEMQADLLAKHVYPERFATLEEIPDDVDVQEPQLKQVLAIEWGSNYRRTRGTKQYSQQEAPIDKRSQEVPAETPSQEVPIDTAIEDQSIETQREETPIDSPQEEVPIDTEIEDQSTENPREEETENVDVRDWDEDSDGENGRGRGTSTIKRSRNRGRVHGGRYEGLVLEAECKLEEAEKIVDEQSR
ncbi:hypothetical protein LINPERHAP2_LOCUS19762 [Linum perenne]